MFGGTTEFWEDFVAAYLVALKDVLRKCFSFLIMFFNTLWTWECHEGPTEGKVTFQNQCDLSSSHAMRC